MDLWLPESAQQGTSSTMWPQAQQKQKSVLLDFDDAEENIRLAEEREREVGRIVHSISELNHVFEVSI